jgi:hypothetical protein
MKLTLQVAFAVTTLLVQSAPAQNAVKFAAEVPKAPAEMPLLTLQTQKPPTELLNRLLSRYDSGAKLAPVSRLPIFERNKLKAPDGVLGLLKTIT